MATIADGARVFTAAAGATALAADQNSLQDALINIENQRTISCTRFAQFSQTCEWIGASSTAAEFPDIYAPIGRAGADDYLYLGIPLPEIAVITSVSVSVTGTNGATGGAIEFVYGTVGSNPAYTAVDMDGVANAWDTGGVAYANVVTYTKSAAPFPLTISANRHVAFRITGNSNPATHACYLWEAKVTYNTYT